MQEHFVMYFTCLLYKVIGGVATTPLLVDFEDLPYPRGRSYTPSFCIKMTAKDARRAIKNHFAYNRAF